MLTIVNALSEEDRPQHRDHYPALFDKCVGSFKSPDSVERLDLQFNVLITRKSNHLQMLEQRKHLLLNNFKNLSVERAGN